MANVNDIRPIELWKNAIRNGKMTKQEAVKACERAMWNLDEVNARYVINMRDVASQVEIKAAADRWMYSYRRGVETPTFFDSFVMFRYRLLWLIEGENIRSAQAERTTAKTDGDGKEVCGRCGGSGVYAYGGVVNGKPVGGTCFRCKGKGRCTRYANELGERGRLERGLAEMRNEIDRARDEYEAETEEPAETATPSFGTVERTCEDCGAVTTGGEWCADCAKARYYIDEKGRGKFRRGPLATHDEIVGSNWEGAVTPQARRRAERRASYASGARA